jgi:hypothetical protein
MKHNLLVLEPPQNDTVPSNVELPASKISQLSLGRFLNQD